ncbi:hypothetical protein HK097_004719, partial [Rhizophlyctis rosea]
TYAVVSHVWGKPGSPDGSLVNMTEDSEVPASILFNKEMRKKFESLWALEEDVWFDACSIDQQSSDAIVTAIECMEDIYRDSKAMLVLVTPSDFDALIQFRDECEHWKQRRNEHNALEQWDDLEQWKVQSRVVGFEMVGKMRATAWLSRIWTLQELILGGDNARVIDYEHHREAAFEEIRSALKWWTDRIYVTSADGDDGDTMGEWLGASATIGEVRPNPSATVFDAITILGCGRRVLNLRDIFYGSNGLLHWPHLHHLAALSEGGVSDFLTCIAIKYLGPSPWGYRTADGPFQQQLPLLGLDRNEDGWRVVANGPEFFRDVTVNEAVAWWVEEYLPLWLCCLEELFILCDQK